MPSVSGHPFSSSLSSRWYPNYSPAHPLASASSIGAATGGTKMGRLVASAVDDRSSTSSSSTSYGVTHEAPYDSPSLHRCLVPATGPDPGSTAFSRRSGCFQERGRNPSRYRCAATGKACAWVWNVRLHPDHGDVGLITVSSSRVESGCNCTGSSRASTVE